MKISRQQLREVRKSFKENKIDENEEEEKITSRRKLIKQIRTSYKDMGGPDKKIDSDIKKKLREERSKQNISISWNFDIGDVVEYKTNNEDMAVGIVLDMPEMQSFRNIKSAIRNSTVQLLTSSGKVNIGTKFITKIEDED